MKPGTTTRCAFVDTETIALRHSGQGVWEAALILGDLYYPAEADPPSYRRPTLTITEVWTGFIDVDLTDADPMSLRLNRLYERHPQYRHAYNEMGEQLVSSAGVHYGWQFGPEMVWTRRGAAHEIARLLFDRTVYGAIPWFDEGQLAAMCREQGHCLAVHYHLVDCEALLAGYIARGSDPVPALCLPPYSSRELAAHVGIPQLDETAHEALPDARWVLDVVSYVDGIDVVWPGHQESVVPVQRAPLSDAAATMLREGHDEAVRLARSLPVIETPNGSLTYHRAEHYDAAGHLINDRRFADGDRVEIEGAPKDATVGVVLSSIATPWRDDDAPDTTGWRWYRVQTSAGDVMTVREDRLRSLEPIPVGPDVPWQQVPEKVVLGVITDNGGGQMQMSVDRDTDYYLPKGARVAMVLLDDEDKPAQLTDEADELLAEARQLLDDARPVAISGGWVADALAWLSRYDLMTHRGKPISDPARPHLPPTSPAPGDAVEWDGPEDDEGKAEVHIGVLQTYIPDGPLSDDWAGEILIVGGDLAYVEATRLRLSATKPPFVTGDYVSWADGWGVVTDVIPADRPQPAWVDVAVLGPDPIDRVRFLPGALQHGWDRSGGTVTPEDVERDLLASTAKIAAERPTSRPWRDSIDDGRARPADDQVRAARFTGESVTLGRVEELIFDDAAPTSPPAGNWRQTHTAPADQLSEKVDAVLTQARVEFDSGADRASLIALIHGLVTEETKWHQRDVERFREDHHEACRTIALMHEAATGRSGEAPQTGVVEDVAAVRERMVHAEARLAELEQATMQAVPEVRVWDGTDDAYRAIDAMAGSAFGWRVKDGMAGELLVPGADPLVVPAGHAVRRNPNGTFDVLDPEPQP